MLSNDLQILLNAFQLVEHEAPSRNLLIEPRERTKGERTMELIGKKEGKGSSKCTVGFSAGRTSDWTDFHYFIETAVKNSQT